MVVGIAGIDMKNLKDFVTKPGLYKWGWNPETSEQTSACCVVAVYF